MKKILVVLTGGTIGSRVEGSSVDVTDTSPYRLIELYTEAFGDSGEAFEVIRPLSILSENVTLDIWTRLCQVMWEIPYEDYEGVILTHGSDTLSYTSALLGMLLRHVPVPVILTASNYPLSVKGSNGLANFRSAVELIRTHLLKGVFTVYQDNTGKNNVYLATRLMESDAYLDQFRSFGGVPLGRMDQGSFIYCEDRVNPSAAELNRMRERIAEESPVFRRQVLFLRPYPGLDYESVSLEKKPAAVLHYHYHSATGCTEGEGSSLLRFAERCQREKIPLYTASSKNISGRNYVTAKAITEKGALPMENISPEAAYVKLLLLYNLNLHGMDGKETEQRAGETLCFENLPYINS